MIPEGFGENWRDLLRPDDPNAPFGIVGDIGPDPREITGDLVDPVSHNLNVSPSKVVQEAVRATIVISTMPEPPSRNHLRLPMPIEGVPPIGARPKERYTVRGELLRALGFR